MIKANLIHLGLNLWGDWEHPEMSPDWGVKSYMRFDESLWTKLLVKMSQCGMNAVVIDLADAVRYRSHPEIAVNDAWSTDKLKDELKHCRDLGLEPLPKFNFSTTHDIWLKEYSRMVSSEKYYQVCRELIEEVIELFDGPRLFHLGMDEEGDDNQLKFLYMVVRHGQLWWHYLNLLPGFVQKSGSTAWVWADKGWNCGPEEFCQNMPKSVVQSNWYYWDVKNPPNEKIKKKRDWFLELDKNGYQQIPCGIGRKKTNYNDHSFTDIVEFCETRISRKNLLGFLQTSWGATLPVNEEELLKSIELTTKCEFRELAEVV